MTDHTPDDTPVPSGTLTLRIEDPEFRSDTTTLTADIDGQPLLSLTLHNDGLRSQDAGKVGALVCRLVEELIGPRWITNDPTAGG